MAGAKEFLERHQFVIIFSTLATVLLAAIVEVVAVHGAGIADWYMHLAMWALILTYCFLTTYMVATARRIRSWLNVAILEFLCIFWIVTMHSRIPAEKVVIESQLTLREPLYVLWLPIVLLGLAALVLPLVALSGKRRRPEKSDG